MKLQIEIADLRSCPVKRFNEFFGEVFCRVLFAPCREQCRRGEEGGAVCVVSGSDEAKAAPLPQKQAAVAEQENAGPYISDKLPQVLQEEPPAPDATVATAETEEQTAAKAREKICPNCAKRFIARCNRQVYCCKDCAVQYNARRQRGQKRDAAAAFRSYMQGEGTAQTDAKGDATEITVRCKWCGERYIPSMEGDGGGLCPACRQPREGGGS